MQTKKSKKNKNNKRGNKKNKGAGGGGAATEPLVDGDDEASDDEISYRIGFPDTRDFNTPEALQTGITAVAPDQRKLESATITSPSFTASLSTGSTEAREAMTVAVGAKEDAEAPQTLIEQIEALQPTNWLNAKDISYIGEIFDTVGGLVASSEVAAFLRKLTRKQNAQKIPAEYREGSSSHKLAVLISATGKKVLFPFAQHNGRELDRHSRDLVIDGFRELFGFLA